MKTTMSSMFFANATASADPALNALLDSNIERRCDWIDFDRLARGWIDCHRRDGT